MIKEKTNNSSLVAALCPPLPLVPSKTPPLPPLPIPSTGPTIANAVVGMLDAVFLSVSTKVKLNSILDCK